MIEVILGAVIMLVGVLVGFVVTVVKNATPVKQNDPKVEEEVSEDTTPIPVPTYEREESITEVKRRLDALVVKLRDVESINGSESSKDELLDEIDDELANISAKI